MQSREAFFSRIAAINNVLQEPIAIDILPVTDPHNVVSRMLRASLTVSLFSFLESYLEDRVFEVISTINKTSIPYAQLPDRFRKLVTIKAVQGISTRIGLEKDNPLALAEAHLRTVGRFANRRPFFSPMGFSSTGSNISDGHIAEFLKDLGITDPWSRLISMSSQFTFSSLDFKQDFLSLSRARNSCAHNPNFIVPSGDIEDFTRSSVRIGVAFDLLITHISYLYRSSSTTSMLTTAINASLPHIAVSKPLGANVWTLHSGGVTHGTYSSEISLLRAAKRLSRFFVSSDQHLVPTGVVSW